MKGADKMYEVKILDYGKPNELEKNVNEFLRDISRKETFQLIDIKFNSYPYGEDQTDYHSAMIIYKV